MNFGAEERNQKLNRHRVSTGRRHVYFYLLLFLATAVGHNVWKLTAQSATPPEVQQAQQIVATANQMNP